MEAGASRNESGGLVKKQQSVTVTVKPQKSVHPTTVLFYHAKHAMCKGNFQKAIETFSTLMDILKIEPVKYQEDIAQVEAYLEQCQIALEQQK